MKQILTTHQFSGGAKIVGLPQASAAGEPVVLEQLQAAIEGLAWKDDVDAAASGNVNLAAPGASIDGVAMSVGMRFLAPVQTAPAQNGVYVWNGAAVAATRAPDMSESAEFNSAVVPVRAGGTANANTTWRCTVANPNVGTTAITFMPFSAAAAAASTTAAGVVELATQAEVDAETDPNVVVTPQTLGAWAGKAKRFAANIGDGSATSFTLNHNLNSRDVTVQIYRNATPWDQVDADIELASVNQVTIKTAAPPAANQYRVVVKY